jgi:hypothetical protein
LIPEADIRTLLKPYTVQEMANSEYIGWNMDEPGLNIISFGWIREAKGYRD